MFFMWIVGTGMWGSREVMDARWATSFVSWYGTRLSGLGMRRMYCVSDPVVEASLNCLKVSTLM